MKKTWWQKEVVYQIYPKSFYDSNNDGVGDIPGIIEKLDYLQTLGITMIWICPIFASPMDDNGYDISDYYHLAPVFGNTDDLDQLITKAKEKGIKIVLDMVLNHTSDEHPWFQEALQNPNSKYHDYYIFKQGETPINNWRSIFGGSVWEKVANRNEYYLHSFGKKQPDLNWENPQLRQELYQIVKHWIKKGIAGFRIDAITFIKKDQTFASREEDGVDHLSKCTKSCRNQPGITKFLNEMHDECFAEYDCVTIAEAAGVRYDQLSDMIGDQGVFSMIFDFAYADLDIASGSEWFKRIDWKVRDLKERIEKSQMAMQNHGWAANFIENHDQPRATTKYLKEASTNPKAVKMLGAMYFFLRGTPFIYQGQELGMTNFERNDISQFDDLSSIDQYHRSIEEGLTIEEALHIVNLRSRDNTRTPMPWSKKPYGGFSNTAPWLAMNENYSDINVEDQYYDDNSIFQFYRRMIQTRQQCDTLVYGDITFMDVHEDVIAYQRTFHDETIYGYFNMSNQPISITLDYTDVYFNNDHHVNKTAHGLILEPYQALLLK